MIAGLLLGSVAVLAPAPVAVGETAAVSVTITPAAGETISQDGPVIVDVRVDEGAGIAPYRYRYWRKDAVDPQASAPRFDIRVRGERAGTWSLTLKILFWECAKKTCVPVKEKREVTVVVKVPPDAGAGGQSQDQAVTVWRSSPWRARESLPTATTARCSRQKMRWAARRMSSASSASMAAMRSASAGGSI